MKQPFRNLGTGFLIGSTMSIPGVSGGTTALALGCYEKILFAAANWRKRDQRAFLIWVLLGGGLGFLSGAQFLGQIYRILPLTATMVFCAAATTGIVLLGKETLQGGCTVNGFLWFVLGIGCVIAVEKLPQLSETSSPLLAFLWGIPLAAGIILPGISTSHLLIVFGQYEQITQIDSLSDIAALIPLAAGTGVGLLLLIKPLAALLNKYPTDTRFALLGFATGSLKALILPCFQNPQMGYLLWFQILNGCILAGATTWAILRLHSPKQKVKNL